jgi:GT2 family glycosyltransferase/ubiquinone/menaquinone biosynthesis C-methylase UbiE
MSADIERFLPRMQGRIAHEHRHRYALCFPYVQGKDVLDVACGEGYGSEILAQNAKHVAAVDIDKRVIAGAKKKYGRNRKIDFQVANCVALPFPDQSFDVVISFETIEHLDKLEQQQFLNEVRRVTRHNSVLIISTPNRDIYSKQSGRGNRFHKSELRRDEFRQLLKKSFKSVDLLGQRFYIPSVIAPLTMKAMPSAKRRPRSQKAIKSTLPVTSISKVADPLYFIAICTDRTADTSHNELSIFIDEKDDLWNEQDKVLRWASSLHEEDEVLREQIQENEKLIAEFREGTERLNVDREALIAALDYKAEAETRLLKEVEHLNANILNFRTALETARLEVAQMEQLRMAEGRSLLNLEADIAASARREQSLLDDRDKMRAELNLFVDKLNGYSYALQAARAEVTGLEGKLVKAERDQAHLFSEVKKLSAQIIALKQSNETSVQRAESAIRETSLLVQKLETTEAKLHVGEQQFSALQNKSEGHRLRNEHPRERLASGLSERTALTNQVRLLDAEVKAAVARLEERDAALRGEKEELSGRNSQLLLLTLRDSLLQEMLMAAGTARARVGQTPLGLTFDNGQLRLSLPVRTSPRRMRRAEWKAVVRSGLFDEQWYLARNPDVATSGTEPFKHFMKYGIAEDRDPHPLFSSGWYRLQMHRHNELTDLPPLLHYLAVGRARRLSPHPLFDPQLYLSVYQDVAESGFDPLDHFLGYGAAEWRNPHPLIWMQRLAEQPGFDRGSKNVLVDYLRDPQLFTASPHPLFDAAAYLTENPDVKSARINPLLHYCAVGWRQGRSPHRVFAGDWYLARNSDVLAADIDPLAHYVQSGAQEHRDPHPLFDVKCYYNLYRDARRLPYDALSDYVLNGLGSEPRETTAVISVADIRTCVPPYHLENASPISAFLNTHLAIAKPASTKSLSSAEEGAAWPPAPSSVYWLPQRLRDYFIDRFGEDKVELYVYLMSIVERFGTRQYEFLQTRDFGLLRDRLLLLAAKRHAEGKLDVSIVVPVYNNLVYTITCILSLLEAESKFSYEIILGDDGCSDATPAVFDSVGGCIRLIRHKENLGFLGNCNRTASFAKGEYIVLLNNDTLVLPRWLDGLIDALAETPKAGLVGSKLINADGSLQEAGGILWRDGSAWNFGRNDDPALPAYNYLKDVDYVSGACLALPAALWRQFGGFDAEFAPAYCEDSDLAFRVRQAGFRAIYAPHSMLIHHEGKSHGRDIGSGIKAYQVENQKKFFSRWKSVLEGNEANAQNVLLARDRSSLKPHILFVDHHIPQWDRDAGSRTMFHFMRLFAAQGFQVSFWPDNLFEDRAYCAKLQCMGVEVIYGHSYVGDFDKVIAEAGPYLDYALVSRPEYAIKYYDAIRANSKARILYYGHDVHWKRMEQARIHAAAWESNGTHTVEAMRALEFDNWRKADIVLYPSVEEREVVRGLMQGVTAANVPMLGYLPNELAVSGRNLARFDKREKDELLFVGGSHPPNVDALLWFAREVMPLVLSENSGARLNIVGATMAAAIERLDSDRIRVLGRVSDEELASLYASMGVAVVPLRFGSGVKGKTLEAFINGIPLVTTSVGLQGIASDTALAFVADDPQNFANAVLRAQIDKATAKGHAEAAVRFIENAYSIKALRKAFAPFVHELALIRNDSLAMAVEH